MDAVGCDISPNGLYIAVVYEDKQIRVWDMTPKTLRIEPLGNTHHGPGTLNNDDLSVCKLGYDVWIRGAHDELLLWVPSNLRPTLAIPPCIAVLNCEFSIELDFLGSVNGEHWQECFDPFKEI